MALSLLQQAAQYLKKALPLMLKYQIPTTPTNYALWYTYVSEQNDQLNGQLDAIVNQYQTCPPSAAEALYREHIGSQQELDTRQLRQSMEAMATELSQSIRDTSSDTSAFRAKLDKNFGKLNQLEQEATSLDQVMDMVRLLVKDSDDILHRTDYFQQQLDKAQQEIVTLQHKLLAAEKDVMFDALTGCHNRRAFDLDFKTLLRDTPKGICVVMCDIDHFKRINDTYGHVLGDQVLKAVANRLKEGCRDSMKVYRFGGEEFAIIVPSSQLQVARHQAESLRRSIEKVTVKDRRKNSTISNISASFGVAEWQMKDSLAKLLERADAQLYEAKRLGRNRVMPISG
ncbi:diguanylate cyclase [Shewanella mangrovi]|uniref:diguanylate cyclase n=1 Tax=Shewanella mangrovi TaxID=1515746 RepID=A0A094JKV2_9GAMM|nr:GGDEF domain-containing protein [Shewanella mangrovi]KFZ38684.1 diguanylate cyclase [Shewanella mangrovi]